MPNNWLLRLASKLIVKPMLKRPMPRGVRLRGVTDGTYGTDPLSTDEGLARFRAAFERLASRPPDRPHPLAGPLTHDQWIQLNLRHAELHLGNLVPT
jgi:hypothetical protein